MTKRPGQIALIIILVVVVGLTVAVSVLSRSVTTVSISTKEQEKARSFSAAEAGVEDALRQDLSSIADPFNLNFFDVGGTGSESSVVYSVLKIPVIQSKISPGRTITIDWAASDPGVTAATVDWSNSSCSPMLIAKQITAIAGVTNTVNSGSTRTFNKITNGLTRFRIVNCSSDTDITITAQGGNLSFYRIDSTGTSVDSRSRVQVVRSEPAAVGLLDYAIFSGGSIQ